MCANKNSDNLSVASLVFGILSLVSPLFPISCGITAIVTGVVQNKREKNSLAKAGIVLGIIGLSLRAISVAVAVLIVLAYYAFIAYIFIGVAGAF